MSKFFKHYDAFNRLVSSLPSTSPPSTSKAAGRVHLNITANTATLTIDNPAVKNAMSPTMMLELGLHISHLSTLCPTSSPATLILRGTPLGGGFCSGADINSASNFLSPESGELMSNYMAEVTDALAELPSVTFSAVDGAAYGGGAELTTATDFR